MVEIKNIVEDYETGLNSGDIVKNDEVVGYVEFTNNDGDVIIADVQVNADYRNKGIGTGVLQKFIKESYSVTLAPTDENNLRLYMRLGFEEVQNDAPEIDQGLGVWEI